MSLVCVDCLFPLHDVLKPTEKRHRWPAGYSFSCSAKMASATDLQDTEDRPVPSSIARDRSLQYPKIAQIKVGFNWNVFFFLTILLFFCFFLILLFSKTDVNVLVKGVCKQDIGGNL